jgi:hypothetical protein
VPVSGPASGRAGRAGTSCSPVVPVDPYVGQVGQMDRATLLMIMITGSDPLSRGGIRDAGSLQDLTNSKMFSVEFNR